MFGVPLCIGLLPVVFHHDSHTLHIMSTVLQSAVHGRFSGCYQGHPNHAVFDSLDPGDILFCHDDGGGYGYYTHCAMYVGNGTVVESSNFRQGTQELPIDNFHFYDDVNVMRLRCPYTLRQSAARYALAQVDKGYNIFGGLQDGMSMYCSKLIWSAYHSQGVDLCPSSRWILPDDLAVSSKLDNVNVSS